MELLERRVYRGPSLYAHFPVMRLTIDLGVLESWPSAKIPGFNDGLLKALPTLRAHTCSFETEGGFVRRLQEDGGTWLGHVLEHVAIELQQLTGANVVFGNYNGIVSDSGAPVTNNRIEPEWKTSHQGTRAGHPQCIRDGIVCGIRYEPPHILAYRIVE